MWISSFSDLELDVMWGIPSSCLLRDRFWWSILMDTLSHHHEVSLQKCVWCLCASSFLYLSEISLITEVVMAELKWDSNDLVCDWSKYHSLVKSMTATDLYCLCQYFKQNFQEILCSWLFLFSYREFDCNCISQENCASSRPRFNTSGIVICILLQWFLLLPPAKLLWSH